MRPIILLDFDGVIADTHRPWLKMYNDEWLDGLEVKDITKWEMHELVKPDCGYLIYEYLKDPYLYANCPAVHGAKEGVKFLQEIGHVYFLTAGLFDAKFIWLADNGFLGEGDDWRLKNNIISTSYKNLIIGDVIIDDYPVNLIGVNRSLRILFDRPWNRSWVRGEDIDVKRAYDWTAITKLVEAYTLQ